jgi:hypothetical protein
MGFWHLLITGKWRVQRHSEGPIDKVVIDRHGDESAVHAVGQAGLLLLLEDGGTEGAAIWRVILMAIEMAALRAPRYGG